MIEQILRRRIRAARDRRIGTAENADQELRHLLRDERLLRFLVRLPHREHERGDQRDDAERGRRHARAMTVDEFAEAIADAVAPRRNRLAGEIALQIARERIGGRVAARRIAAHRGDDDGVEIAAQMARADRRGVVGDAAGQRNRRRRIERALRGIAIDIVAQIVRPLAREQFEQHDAERIDVRRGAHRIAAQLLRRGVRRRQWTVLRVDGLRRAAVRIVEEFGDAEIEQLRFAVGGDQNVRRLDVAMDDELAVRELHRRADIAEQRDAFFDAQLALRGVAQQRFAVDVFHREVRTSIVGDAAVEQARDVRMFETREDLPLAQETRLHRIGIHAALDDLQRGALLELSVGAFGEQHHAHAAAAEFAQHAPRADACRAPSRDRRCSPTPSPLRRARHRRCCRNVRRFDRRREVVRRRAACRHRRRRVRRAMPRAAQPAHRQRDRRSHSPAASVRHPSTIPESDPDRVRARGMRAHDASRGTRCAR